MKRMTWIVAFAAATAASAYAQQTYEPTVPRGLSDSRVEPSGTLAPPVQPQIPRAVMTDPAVPQLAMNVQRHQRDADARRCLQLPTNTQIHRCAERYRSHASRAHVSKASLKTTAPASASAAVQEKVVVQSKTAEPPKPVETAKVVAPAPAPAAPPGSTTITTTKTTVTTTQPATKPAEPAKATK